MSNIGLTIVLFILIIIVIFIIVIIFAKIHAIYNPYKGILEYNIQMPYKYNGRGMNFCLPGCVRGVCDMSSSADNACNYNFQCSKCQDRSTNMFYANFNNEREIIPIYEEEETLTYNEAKVLNKAIVKNNKYINLLNNKIEILNRES